jgi:hypothetical protein
MGVHQASVPKLIVFLASQDVFRGDDCEEESRWPKPERNQDFPSHGMSCVHRGLTRETTKIEQFIPGAKKKRGTARCIFP